MNERSVSIPAVLESIAERQPTAPAIRTASQSPVTYGELAAQIRYVRGRLSDWRIHCGDMVAAALTSRPQLAVAIATLPSSCTFAPLDPSLSVDSYLELLMRLKPKAVVALDKGQHAIREAARRLDIMLIDLTPGRDTAALFTLDVASRGSYSSRPLDGGVAYVLTSSGTTGRRKLVPVDHRVVLHYATAMAERLSCTAEDVSLHNRPLYWGSGLRSGLMNALLTGSSVILLPEGDVEAALGALVEFQPTFFSAGYSVFRTLDRRASKAPHLARGHHLRFMLAGAGPLDPDACDRLETLFGVPMLIGFSSTETSRISLDPLPPRLRKRGASGLPLANEVGILGNDGQIRARGEFGEIVVRGPMVFRGYLDDAELNDASFLGDWFRTGDLGRIDDDGYVFVTGRLKEIINRGGEKISPVEVDLAIESVTGVAEAATFGVPHPTLGEEVVAAVMREPGASVDASAVVKRVGERLGVRKAPRRVYFVEELPRTDTGKVKRGDLRATFVTEGLTADPVAATAAVSPHTGSSSPIEGVLGTLWSAALNGVAAGRNDDFFLRGGDSLAGEQLLLQVKEVFGVDVPLELLYGRAGTIAGMAEAILVLRAEAEANRKAKKTKSGRKVRAAGIPDQRHEVILNIPPLSLDEMLERQRAFVRTWAGSRPAADDVIVGFNETGTRLPLYICLQSEKGLAYLARFLGPDQPIYGLRSGFRVMTYTDENVETLGEHYAEQLIARQPQGPFIIGGNCQGGRIARATALQLRERGRHVSMLILIEPRTFPRYNGRVALIFAKDSHLNPYNRPGDPDAVFRRAYPGGYSADTVTGAHGKAFFSNHVGSLIAVLKQRLDELAVQPARMPAPPTSRSGPDRSRGRWFWTLGDSHQLGKERSWRKRNVEDPE